MICGFQNDEALDFYSQMLHHGIKPDQVTPDDWREQRLACIRKKGMSLLFFGNHGFRPFGQFIHGVYFIYLLTWLEMENWWVVGLRKSSAGLLKAETTAAWVSLVKGSIPVNLC